MSDALTGRNPNRRSTTTLRLPPDVASLLAKASARRLGVSKTYLICEAIRAHYQTLATKRDQAPEQDEVAA